jgi:membrane associated rhomboid family serine protease
VFATRVVWHDRQVSSVLGARAATERPAWRLRDFFTAGLRSPAVLTVISATTAVWVLQVLFGPHGPTGVDDPIYRDLLAGVARIGQGQWWRLATSQLIHDSWWHLWGNMWPLYLFGPLVERAYGRAWFVIVYFTCAVSGVLLTIGLSHGLGFAGASVAVYGIHGTVIVLALSRLQQPGMWAYLVGATINVAAEWWPYTVVNFHINQVHLYGLLTGAVLATAFATARRVHWPSGAQAVITAAVVAVAVTIAVARWPALPRRAPTGIPSYVAGRLQPSTVGQGECPPSLFRDGSAYAQVAVVNSTCAAATSVASGASTAAGGSYRLDGFSCSAIHEGSGSPWASAWRGTFYAYSCTNGNGQVAFNWGRNYRRVAVGATPA